VGVNSDWSNHALGLDASAQILRYANSTSEDVENYTVTTRGRLDIRRDSNLYATAGFQRHHEDRGSPDDVNGAEPTEFMIGLGQIGFFQRFNRLSARLQGGARRINFDDVPTEGTGEINNDDRDRTEYDTSLRLAYEFQVGYQAFVQGSYDVTNYDDPRDDNGFERDSKGYQVVGGLSLDLTDLIIGEFFAGYFSEDFDDPEFADNSSYALGADFTWSVTPLTTTRFGVSRTVEETTVADASSTTSTNVSLSVGHNLLRNLVLNAGASYQRNDFKGTSRNDDTISVKAGATYLMNRYVHVTAGYQFTTRDSNAAGESYDQNVAKIDVRFQY
jgi:hypothetical protein